MRIYFSHIVQKSGEIAANTAAVSRWGLVAFVDHQLLACWPGSRIQQKRAKLAKKF
jgi:hypothetical protein